MMRISSRPDGTDPLTGFCRDGSCSTEPEVPRPPYHLRRRTGKLLEHQRSIGNGLSTPAPQYRFPGLVAGDR